jgi:uncharacterized protein with FMN-binding domain
MRRVLIPVAGLFATTALLVALKSGPGVMRLPDRAPVVQWVAPATADPAASDPAVSDPAGPSGEARPDPADPSPSPGPNGTTYIGDSVYTEFGYVTAQVTVVDGRIVDVVLLEMPADGARSVVLSDRVALEMRERVLAAQSANVDTVSGATWTSEAYRQSVRSALVKAGLA